MSSRGNKGELLSLGPLLVSAFLLFGFNNAATSAMPEYIMAMGGGPFLAGLQNSLFVLLAMGLRLALGPLADRVGGKRMLLLGAAGFCLPCALLPLCQTLAAAIALRLLQCVGLAAYHPNVSLYITEHSAGSQLTSRISLARFASTASLMVVPAVLFPLVGSGGYGVFFTALAFVGFAGLLFLLPLAPSPAAPSGKADNGGLPCRPPLPPSNSPRYSPLLKATIAMPALLACGYSVLLVFGPSFMLSLDPQANSGLLLSAVSAGGLAGSLGAAPLSRIAGVRGATALAGLCFSGGMAVLVAQSTLSPAIFIGSALAGLGYFGGITALNAHLGHEAQRARAGVAFAQQQSCLDGGMMAGSLLAGAMLQTGLGYQAVIGCTAALLALGALAWFRLTRTC